jgi:hypothetical protein
MDLRERRKFEKESGMMRHGMDEKTQDPEKHYGGPLVVAKRFKGLPDAFVAKSILDSAGIDSFFTDEKVLGMVYPSLIDTVKLMVRPEDLEAAVQLLSRTSAEEIAEETALEELLRKATLPTESGEKEK